jgi:ABC-type sugar transport system ATPase subunit
MPDLSLDVSRLTLTHSTPPQGTAMNLGPISFCLPLTGCWWLTGVSGAGKSLLLESLAGFHAGAAGAIRIADREVAHLAPEDRNVTLMPQRWKLFPHWTVRRNLQFAAKLSKTPPDHILELAQRLKVNSLLDRSTSALSGGESQRIALIQTLLSSAKVLLLDEPFSAVDAALQSVMLRLLIDEASRTQRIFLIAAHRTITEYPLQGTLRLESGHLISPELP